MKKCYRELKFLFSIIRFSKLNLKEVYHHYNDIRYCGGCGNKPDYSDDFTYKYHSRWGTCSPECYADMVGVSLY